MLKRTLSAAAVLCLAVGCASESDAQLGGKDSSTLSKTDNTYFRGITEGNLTEIQSSQMALQQSSNPRVKEFAQTMINDHTSAGTSVMSIAQSKNVVPPTMLDSSHKEMVQTLDGKSGADFDKAYLDLQVKAHQATINLDQDEADNGNDPDVKNLATTLLPTLKGHLSMAKKLQSDMMGGM